MFPWRETNSSERRIVFQNCCSAKESRSARRVQESRRAEIARYLIHGDMTANTTLLHLSRLDVDTGQQILGLSSSWKTWPSMMSFGGNIQ